MSNVIKLITFDATGTLIRPRGGSVGSIYAHATRKFGVAIKDEQVAELDKGFFKAWKQMTTSEPNFGYPSKSSKDWWRSVVFSTFNTARINLKPDQGHAIFEHLFEEFKEAKNWDVFEEVHPVLRKLKQESSRIKLGVVSNFDERLSYLGDNRFLTSNHFTINQHDIMRNTKLDNYFDFILASREVGIEKPDPRIFHRAIELAAVDARTGILPHEAMHIGDHIKKDYEAAKGLGMRSILLVRQETALDPTNVAEDQKANLNFLLDLLCNK